MYVCMYVYIRKIFRTDCVDTIHRCRERSEVSCTSMAMASHSPRRFLLLLLYILSLHAISIFFFTRGFLLTRNELPLYSRCGDIYATEATVGRSSDQCDRVAFEDNSCNCSRVSSDSETGNCWTRPLVNKVVILVLDALRYAYPSHALAHHCAIQQIADVSL